MWAKLLCFAVPHGEGIWLFSAAWFGIFTVVEEVVCWRSHGVLESIWLQLPPQIGAPGEAESKSTEWSVFVSDEFNSLRGKGRPVQRSSDFGQHCCCSTPPCHKLGLSAGAGQRVPASVMAAAVPGELQEETGSDSGKGLCFAKGLQLTTDFCLIFLQNDWK